VIRRARIFVKVRAHRAKAAPGGLGLPSWSTLKPDDVMVPNLNARATLQGTDTTIIKLVPNGTPVTFFGGSARTP
jgi:hypothetical protein